jgi:hypothetical protein
MVARGEHVRMITQSQTAKPVRVAAVAVIAGVMAIAAACSSGPSANSSGGTASRTASPPPHTGSPSANKSTCKHVDSVRTSLEDLTHLQLNASSATKIRTDLSNIQAQLAMLKSEGVGPPLSSSLNQLSASLKQVEKAAKGLSAPPSASEISAVVSALSALKTQSGVTIAAMRSACPG